MLSKTLLQQDEVTDPQGGPAAAVERPPVEPPAEPEPRPQPLPKSILKSNRTEATNGYATDMVRLHFTF